MNTKNFISINQTRGGLSDENKRITRAEKREQLEDFNACCELYKILRHFFPGLIPLLKQIKDSRHQSYITYENQVILYVRILAAAFHIGSMRKITVNFNSRVCIENFKQTMGLTELAELPHWKTINDYLEQLDPKELEVIIPKLVSRLIRMHTFDDSRIRGKYWQIIVDGTELYNTNERHCPHCLTREHKDKEGNIIWTEYYHCVLEAKLVLNGKIVVSIATEFIENEEPNVSKQDCERKAFYRLEKKLKQYFPRLPICLCADSLYACGPVFDICKRNNWHYIIRFKNGSLPSVAEEFHALKSMEPEQTFSQTVNGVKETYRYVSDIPYQAHTLNVVEYTASSLKYAFVFITDLPISKRNFMQTVQDGRRRWKIENEGFNTQKNQGYELEHLFSEDYNAIKNHYFLIQIGHMIAQLFENALQIWKSILAPDYMIFQILKQSFQTFILSDAVIQVLNVRRQYRFP